MDKVGILCFWNSSFFLPKGVSTEMVYKSHLVERTRDGEAGMGVSLINSVPDNRPGRSFLV